MSKDDHSPTSSGTEGTEITHKCQESPCPWCEAEKKDTELIQCDKCWTDLKGKAKYQIDDKNNPAIRLVCADCRQEMLRAGYVPDISATESIRKRLIDESNPPQPRTIYKFKEILSYEGHLIDDEWRNGLELKDNQEIHSIHYQSNASTFDNKIGWHNSSVLVVIKETIE